MTFFFQAFLPRLYSSPPSGSCRALQPDLVRSAPAIRFMGDAGQKIFAFFNTPRVVVYLFVTSRGVPRLRYLTCFFFFLVALVFPR